MSIQLPESRDEEIIRMLREVLELLRARRYPRKRTAIERNTELRLARSAKNREKNEVDEAKIVRLLLGRKAR